MSEQPDSHRRRAGSTYDDHDVVIELYEFVGFAILRDHRALT